MRPVGATHALMVKITQIGTRIVWTNPIVLVLHEEQSPYRKCMRGMRQNPHISGNVTGIKIGLCIILVLLFYFGW